MDISVIIPTYKPQSYIWECLDSLKNQTFAKERFEIILVLNGCREPYYSQIHAYIENNLHGYNVNFIQTDQGGVSNARNIALDKDVYGFVLTNSVRFEGSSLGINNVFDAAMFVGFAYKFYNKISLRTGLSFIKRTLSIIKRRFHYSREKFPTI